jgi:hypothetical protein
MCGLRDPQGILGICNNGGSASAVWADLAAANSDRAAGGGNPNGLDQVSAPQKGERIGTAGYWSREYSAATEHQQRGIPAMATTRVQAAQYLKDAGGLKLVVFGADGHEVAAMFVQGSVTYDAEEATFIAVDENGQMVGELFVDETVGYDENTDAFVIRTVQ